MEPKLLFTDRKGRIFEHGLAPCGSEGGVLFRLRQSDLIPLPKSSRLFTLPGRTALGYDGKADEFIMLRGHRPLCAFLPAGYLVTHSPAMSRNKGAGPLPLFAYSAVALSKGGIYASAISVDRDLRHDQSLIDLEEVRLGITKLKKAFPENRLIGQLAKCALNHDCPNAQNLFLSRYECPLPVSPYCNAKCIGCISRKPDRDLKASQPRLCFLPAPSEVSEIAVYHLENTKDAVASFGQGCEGEPLMRSGVIEKAIRLIRRSTRRGTINMNTNASRPKEVARLAAAGLDSVRISLNSARRTYYERYYRPRGYSFRDVVRGIDMAGRAGLHVSLNYLTIPGFTDSKMEIGAFASLIESHPVDTVQLRNLNIDPDLYFDSLSLRPRGDEIIGMRKTIRLFKDKFPGISVGCFNPRATASRHRSHRD